MEEALKVINTVKVIIQGAKDTLPNLSLTEDGNRGEDDNEVSPLITQSSSRDCAVQSHHIICRNFSCVKQDKGRHLKLVKL